MSHNSTLPDGLIAYGPDANCTLAVCSIDDSVYQYRPSNAASGAFIAFFAVGMLIHIAAGLRWREWTFMSCMIAGCLDEIIGYIGRIMLHHNPFSFTGFIMQIVCITTAPVFFCAAIYVLLVRITRALGNQYSLIRPTWYLIIFLPCDIISLVLQAAGGAMSSTSSGSNQNGVDIALAGLSFQVVTLFAFSVLCVAYFFRYWRDRRNPSQTPLPKGFTIWASALTLAVVCIFIRCAYRIDELKDGYSGSGTLTDQGLFNGLEGSMIVVAVWALILAHPGPVFDAHRKANAENVVRGIDASDDHLEEKGAAV